jgi:hypothetical protein
MPKFDGIKTYCKHCSSPISHSQYGVENQMCDLCIAQKYADLMEFEN